MPQKQEFADYVKRYIRCMDNIDRIQHVRKELLVHEVGVSYGLTEIEMQEVFDKVLCCEVV